MTDDLDKLLDTALEAEKAHALARHRLHPIVVPSSAKVTIRSHQWVGFRKYAVGGAVLGMLALSIILLLPGRNLNSRIEVATVQRALLTANAALPDTALQRVESGSDMSWTVQRAIVHARRLEYPKRDLNNTVLAALLKTQKPEQRSASSENASSAELDQRIERLASEGTVERALLEAEKKTRSGR